MYANANRAGVLGVLVLAFLFMTPACQAAHLLRAAGTPGDHRGLSCADPNSAGHQASQASAGSGNVAYGINFNWSIVRIDKLQICETGRPGITIQPGDMLAVYDQPGVRAVVQDQLRKMSASGFTEIKTQIPTSPDRLTGYFQVDEDQQRTAAILRNYIADVQAAGFRRLEIGFGTRAGGQSCGSGACLDDDVASRTIAYYLAVRHAITVPAALDLTFDLAMEMCLWPGRPQQGNLGNYMDRLVAAYVTAFPQDKTTISCSGRKFLEGRASIDAAYAGAKRSGPDFYELHLYSAPAPRFEPLADSIDQIKEALANSHTPLIVGETGYGNAGTVQDLISGLGKVAGGLRAIYFWPKRYAWPLQCAVDVAPPYDLNDALGKK